MKDLGIVYGSAEQAEPLIIGVDTVYVHTDITPLINENDADSHIFKYHEIQYGKDEYIKLISEKNTELENQLTNTQVALCEIYEMMEV